MVMRLGRLGDMVAKFNDFAYIRKLHPDAHITLLTGPDYVELMSHCPWFDEIMNDNNPPSSELSEIIKVNRRIAEKKFDLIYNFQYLRRRGFRYLFLVWSKKINVFDVPPDFIADKSWLRKADISKFNLPKDYFVIVPGCTPQYAEKRWAAENYGKLCAEIKNRGYIPVIVGTPKEKEIANEIIKHCPTAIDLLAKTNMLELMKIVDNAKCVIGNDTGPIHIGHYMEKRTIALISAESKFFDFFLQRYYRDPHFSTVISESFAELTVDEVLKELPF